METGKNVGVAGALMGSSLPPVGYPIQRMDAVCVLRMPLVVVLLIL